MKPDKNYVEGIAYILTLIMIKRQIMLGEILASIFAEALNNDLAALGFLITSLK